MHDLIKKEEDHIIIDKQRVLKRKSDKKYSFVHELKGDHVEMEAHVRLS